MNNNINNINHNNKDNNINPNENIIMQIDNNITYNNNNFYINNNNINNNINNNFQVQFNTGNDLFDFTNRVNPEFHGRPIVGPVRRTSPEYIRNFSRIHRNSSTSPEYIRNFSLIRRNSSDYSNSSFKKTELTQNQIDQLPIEFYDPNLNYNINKCMICLEDFKNFEELRRLECLHIYHKDCIDKWLKKNNCCPIDKYKVKI